MIRALATALILFVGAIPLHAQQTRQLWLPIIVLDDGTPVEAAAGTFTADATIDDTRAVAVSIRVVRARGAPIYRQLAIKLGDCAKGGGGIYEFDPQDNFIKKHNFTLVYSNTGGGFDLIGTVMCETAVELLKNKRQLRI